MDHFKAILFVAMIAGVTSEAHYGYPSYIYNQPQYYAQSYPSFPSYPSYNYAYSGVAESQAYQQQRVGVSYGPIHSYQPVVKSVREIYYEPEAPQVESVPVSFTAPAESESVSATRRVVPPLRAIFPDFSKAGLRSKSDIGFLRPDQVKPLPEKFLSPNIISF